MSRTQRLMDAAGYDAKAMAAYLGIHRSNVSRLVNGAPESGPVSRLLDLLEQNLAADPGLTSAGGAVAPGAAGGSA